MNVLLIGGSGSLINNLIVKFNKEGHRVYLITGERHSNAPYQRVFERYDFSYEATCLKEVFESINMDVTIFLGAFDTNFNWKNEEGEAVRYASGLMNILMSYSMKSKGKFIYLSSHEVFEALDSDCIGEDAERISGSVKGMTLIQAEDMCESYRTYRGLDIITLRMDHLYTFPKIRKEVNDICGKMCLEALETGKISVNTSSELSLLYESDATQYIFNVARAPKHNFSVYNISSMQKMTEMTLAEIIISHMDTPVSVTSNGSGTGSLVLSNNRFQSEFGNLTFCNPDGIIKKITDYMQKNRYVFLNDLDKKPSLSQRIFDKAGWFIRAVIPFFENMVAFIPFFMLNNRATGSEFFANLDFYLLYVLLFAIVYGQQQAIFSAVLAVAGYIFRQMYDRSGFEVLIDSNTYVWIAQLFIVGMAVGYLRDQIKKLRKESVDENDFLKKQLVDIQDINNTNVRVKDALETQIINQNDSIGKIYKITSELNQFSNEEVLFKSADMVSSLVKSDDVAIYIISNSQYARLFSATSRKARGLGNSLRYRELGEMYEELSKKKVYINRKLDEHFPLMANAIFDEEDRMQIIVMIWSMPWENMTLGQANQLVVISALIRNAVIRSNKYLEALQEKRFIPDTNIMSAEAFRETLINYQQAETEGLAECVVLKVLVSAEYYREAGLRLMETLRDSDILGVLEDGSLYIILANTKKEEAIYAMKRIEGVGIGTEYVEDGVVCLRTDRI